MSVAETVRSRVDRSPVGTFFLASHFEGSPRAVESALSRMVKEHSSLCRVRKGLYWKGVRSRFGMGRPDPVAVARTVARASGRCLGPTGWSASLALGLSTQLPAMPEFAISGPAPTGVSGVRFRSRLNPARNGLGYLDIALLEVLASWPRRSEADWEDLLAVSRRLAKEGKLHLKRIEKAASSENSRLLRANFAKLAEDLGLIEPAAA